ncbi:hypothetical protein DFH09DRAFT_1470830 [Mycena vulgaris]|nr:hypothetical protein DFH09DRAFT_1470830 [Mycena vulgaris]
MWLALPRTTLQDVHPPKSVRRMELIAIPNTSCIHDLAFRPELYSPASLLLHPFKSRNLILLEVSDWVHGTTDYLLHLPGDRTRDNVNGAIITELTLSWPSLASSTIPTKHPRAFRSRHVIYGICRSPPHIGDISAVDGANVFICTIPGIPMILSLSSGWPVMISRKSENSAGSTPTTILAVNGRFKNTPIKSMTAQRSAPSCMLTHFSLPHLVVPLRRRVFFAAIHAALQPIITLLDVIETRLDAIDTRLDAIETCLDGVDAKIDGVAIFTAITPTPLMDVTAINNFIRN